MTFVDGGSFEGSIRNRAILVGSDWADMSVAMTELEKRWQCGTLEHSVGSRCHGAGRRMLS